MNPDSNDVRPALDLLACLERQGFVFSMADGKPVIAPASLLTDTHKDALRQHKDALTWLVTNMPSPEQQAALDALSPPDFAGCVALVERLSPPDGPDPVPDESLWLIRKILRAKQSKRKKFKPAKPLPPRTLFGGKP